MHVSMCHMNEVLTEARSGQSDALELESHNVDSYHVNARNCTSVL